MTTIDNKNYAFLCEKNYCNICDYGTSKKSSFKNHCESKKHKYNILSTNGNENYANLCSSKYQCEKCDKQFKDRSGLWRHKKKCTYTKDDEEMMIDGINIKDKDALVFHLLKQNTDLQNKIIDMISKTNNTNSHNTNSYNTTNNKTFNLQFFLNETCKNAMNITDFVSSIKMELDDLEHTGRTNYVEGISNIVIKNLNNLEQQLRPLHCSDFKREVLYIKDNDQWTKETNNKPILTNAIKKIANENIKQINKWVQQYPDCTKADSKKNDLYLKIVSNSMNGLTQEEGEKNMNKIISNVAKNVIIDK
jgi:hypothetical protein